MKKVWLGIGSAVILAAGIGGYFYSENDSAATQAAKLALKNHPLMTATYAEEEFQSIGASYSTVMCDFKINGMSALFPKDVIEDNRRGNINSRTDNSVMDAELLIDYGKNRLTVDAMAPIHYPRDGTYFFCEGRALGEAFHLNISGKNDPFAYSGKSSTQVVTNWNEPANTPEVDYQDVDWIIYKPKGDEENLEITYKDTKTFNDSLLPDVSVSTHFYLEKADNNLPSQIFWRDSEPFEETPENMVLLWDAYDEILTAFESQKQSEVIKALEMAFIQSELVIGRPDDLIFTNYRLQDYQENWDQYGFKRAHEDKLEDYELQIADHKKLFKLVLKTNNEFEPVHFALPGEEDRYIIYHFYFTMIDGKPRVAFLERKVIVI